MEIKNQTYRIYNKKDNEKYYRTFNNNSDCYHWIVNHLDLSKNGVTITRNVDL